MRTTLLFLLFLVASNAQAQYNFKAYPMQEKDQVVYVYDALCGWCYGFSDVINQLEQEFGNRIDFAVLSGGMMTGQREEPISKMRDYIKGAYERVENTCGVKFGDAYLNGILESPTYISSSVKPAIAMAVFKSNQPKKAVAFAKAIQRAFYLEGKSLNENATYGALAKDFGLDKKQFEKQMDDATFKTLAEQEFQLVKQMGITGFPTLFVIKDGQAYLLSNGYSSFISVAESLEQVLSQSE
jgi:putative protein-disulfide isomerase